MSDMSEKAKEKRNESMKKWRDSNPDKIAAQKYWESKARSSSSRPTAKTSGSGKPAGHTTKTNRSRR